ncbi:MAG: hypothetical protein AAFX06_21945 [Planctomycetota bacterium]
MSSGINPDFAGAAICALIRDAGWTCGIIWTSSRQIEEFFPRLLSLDVVEKGLFENYTTPVDSLIGKATTDADLQIAKEIISEVFDSTSMDPWVLPLSVLCKSYLACAGISGHRDGNFVFQSIFRTSPELLSNLDARAFHADLWISSNSGECGLFESVRENAKMIGKYSSISRRSRSAIEQALSDSTPKQYAAQAIKLLKGYVSEDESIAGFSEISIVDLCNKINSLQAESPRVPIEEGYKLVRNACLALTLIESVHL